MKILVKFPCRSRPDKFKNTFSRYIDLAKDLENLNFVFTFDEDDASMNSEDIRNFLSPYSRISEINYGKSQNKIEAINADLDNKVFDILLLASDDLVPQVKDYDEIIINHMIENFPDTDGSLQYYSAMWADTLDIMCILGYKYYKRFNYIYHPAYKGLFCDNEFTEVKKMLNKNKFYPIHLFDHNFASDDISWRSNKFQHDDFRVYESRKLLNFDIPL